MHPSPDHVRAFDHRRHQEKARTATILIVSTFTVLVLVIGAIIGVGTSWGMVIYMGEKASKGFNWGMALWTSGATAVVIVLASGYKALSLRGDGGRIAESLGGELIEHGDTNPNHRRFLNIVEEMAISAGMPVPKAYVVRHESGINAFAAGSSPRNSAIAVTHGALAKLNRKELTGVVAHEMAHIANADTRLNGRLMALVFGLVALTTIGRVIIRSAPRSRSSSNKGNAAAFVLILGVLLVVVGALGVLAGRILQSMASRQRELLADASAVQFTRDPTGLAGALKKIGASTKGSRVETAHAEEARHMFFASSSDVLGRAFATHPPLQLRIRLLDPDFSPSRDAIWNGNDRDMLRQVHRETAGPWG